MSSPIPSTSRGITKCMKTNYATSELYKEGTIRKYKKLIKKLNKLAKLKATLDLMNEYNVKCKEKISVLSGQKCDKNQDECSHGNGIRAREKREDEEEAEESQSFLSTLKDCNIDLAREWSEGNGNEVIKVENNEIYRCLFPNCGSLFTSESQFQSHKNIVHDIKKPLTGKCYPNVCGLCDMTFPTVNSLIYHQAATCNSFKNNYKKHLSCEHEGCSYKTRYVSNMKNHIFVKHNPKITSTNTQTNTGTNTNTEYWRLEKRENPTKIKLLKCDTEKCGLEIKNVDYTENHVLLKPTLENCSTTTLEDKTESVNNRAKSKYLSCSYEGCTFETKNASHMKYHVLINHTSVLRGLKLNSSNSGRGKRRGRPIGSFKQNKRKCKKKEGLNIFKPDIKPKINSSSDNKLGIKVSRKNLAKSLPKRKAHTEELNYFQKNLPHLYSPSTPLSIASDTVTAFSPHSSPTKSIKSLPGSSLIRPLPLIPIDDHDHTMENTLAVISEKYTRLTKTPDKHVLYQCKTCAKTLLNEQSLKYHILSQHCNVQSGVCNINGCLFKAANQAQMIDHIRFTHNQTFKLTVKEDQSVLHQFSS